MLKIILQAPHQIRPFNEFVCTIESDVVLFATQERRIIDRDITYEDSDHHQLKESSRHIRLYLRRGEGEAVSW